MAEIDDLKKLLEAYKGLVEVSNLINSITEYEELLPAILGVSQRVMDADASSILLADEQGDLRVLFASGPAGESVLRESVVIPSGKGIAGWVFTNGRSLLVPDAYADPRFFPEVDRKTGFRTRSILCAPLVRGGKKIGVVQVLNPRKKEAFNQTDMEAFDAYASLVATAIEKLRTLERQRHQEQTARDLAIAHDIQHSLLPQELPVVGDLRFASAYKAALNIGGDFYDVIRMDRDEVFFVIGDVSGKGIPAALLMAQALGMLRMLLKPGMPPCAALEEWNEMLFGHTIRGMFITATIGRVIPSQRRVELASAAHCAPLIAHREGSVGDVLVRNTPPLGVIDKLEPQTHALRLLPGEWLVFFTDGLSESFNPQGALLERSGISGLLKGQFSSIEAVVDAVVVGESLHRKDAQRHDDLTILGCGFHLPQE
jgi:sigma-B regulation protein RsbU (phosphoserine phosphatase)